MRCASTAAARSVASWLRGCAAYVSGRAEPPLSPPPALHARTVLPLSSDAWKRRSSRGGAVCTHRTEATRRSVAMRRRRRAAAAGSCNTASMLRACHLAGARGGSGAKAAGPRRPSACGGGARSRRTPPARRLWHLTTCVVLLHVVAGFTCSPAPARTGCAQAAPPHLRLPPGPRPPCSRAAAVCARSRSGWQERCKLRVHLRTAAAMTAEWLAARTRLEVRTRASAGVLRSRRRRT